MKLAKVTNYVHLRTSQGCSVNMKSHERIIRSYMIRDVNIHITFIHLTQNTSLSSRSPALYKTNVN